MTFSAFHTKHSGGLIRVHQTQCSAFSLYCCLATTPENNLTETLRAALMNLLAAVSRINGGETAPGIRIQTALVVFKQR